jgi:hypothetical protein
MTKFQAIIGRAERIDLTEIVLNVPAKIDSGAFRSAIHCKKAKVVKRGDKEVLVADLLGHPCSPVIYHQEFEDFQVVNVTNSGGHEEERYAVELKVKLGPKVFHTSFTLADRSGNLFPILVGRKILKNRFVIDVAKTGVTRAQLLKEFNLSSGLDEEDAED